MDKVTVVVVFATPKYRCCPVRVPQRLLGRILAVAASTPVMERVPFPQMPAVEASSVTYETKSIRIWLTYIDNSYQLTEKPIM